MLIQFSHGPADKFSWRGVTGSSTLERIFLFWRNILEGCLHENSMKSRTVPTCSYIFLLSIKSGASWWVILRSTTVRVLSHFARDDRLLLTARVQKNWTSISWLSGNLTFRHWPRSRWAAIAWVALSWTAARKPTYQVSKDLETLQKGVHKIKIFNTDHHGSSMQCSKKECKEIKPSTWIINAMFYGIDGPWHSMPAFAF